MTNQTPAQKYRLKIKDFGVWNTVPDDVDLDNFTRDRGQELFIEFKQELNLKFEAGATQDEVKGLRNGIYLTAIILFAFGHLEVAEDILDNIISKSAKGAFQCVWMIRDLLPMPKGMFDPDNSEPTREWLRNNAHKLEWNEVQVHYTFIENTE